MYWKYVWSQKDIWVTERTGKKERETGESKERETDWRRDRDSLPPAFLCSAMIASEAEKWITLLLQHFLI